MLKKDEEQAVGPVYKAALDINGIWRGKRYALSAPPSVSHDALKKPLSILAVDVWGRDVPDNPIFLEAGDPDGTFLPTGREPIELENSDKPPSYLIPTWAVDESNKPHLLDPRSALFDVAEDVAKRELKAGIGMELEFYLVRGADHIAATSSEHTLAIAEMRRYEPLIDDLYATCERNDIALETIVSEAGGGQFEVVLKFGRDIVKAADDFAILKFISRHVAQNYGLDACFMAKPFSDRTGNGFHTHVSLSNENGQNIFADGLRDGPSVLKHAIGGTLAAMPQSMLVFAPHFNSYRRFSENTMAPTSINWGINNRTVSVRVADPEGDNIRLEHRISGADANPYLALTAILKAMLYGMDNKIDPGLPIDGNGYLNNVNHLPSTWNEAIAEFENAAPLGPLFPTLLQSSFLSCKKQELRTFSQTITPLELSTYGMIV